MLLDLLPIEQGTQPPPPPPPPPGGGRGSMLLDLFPLEQGVAPIKPTGSSGGTDYRPLWYCPRCQMVYDTHECERCRKDLERERDELFVLGLM